MSALYQIQYQGAVGNGHGALYIGRGVVLGVDIAGSRYRGAYAEKDGMLIGQVIMTAAGGPLVTGQTVGPGVQVPINFSFPPDFANGSFQTVTVAGQQAKVAFTKIGDVP